MKYEFLLCEFFDPQMQTASLRGKEYDSDFYVYFCRTLKSATINLETVVNESVTDHTTSNVWIDNLCALHYDIKT